MCCAELAFIFLTVFLGIFLINKYSTALLIFICGILTYVLCSLWLKFFNDDYCEERLTARNYFNRFLISSWSLCLHVICAIRGSYAYRKIREISSRLQQWYCRREESTRRSLSPCKRKYCGLALSVETELKIVIENILHTYIRSWYCKLSPNTDFIREINYALEDVFLALGNGISQMDKKEFIYHIIQVYLRFFRHYVDALHKVKSNRKQGTLEKCIAMKKEISENFKMDHWALESPHTEWHYLQSFMANMVETFGPVELKTSRLLQNVVVEVLTQNLMSPVVDLLSDPDQLNSWVLKFLKGIAKEQKLPLYSFIQQRTQSSPPQPEPEQDGKRVEDQVSRPTIVISSQISVSEENKTPEEVFSAPQSPSGQVLLSIDDIPLRRRSTTSVFSVENDSMSENSISINVSRSSSVAENRLNSPNSLIESPRFYSNIDLSAQELTTACLDNNMLGVSNIKRSRSADFIRQMSQPNMGLLPLNARNHSIRLSGRNNKTYVKFRANYCPSTDVEQAEEAVEAEVPHLFDDVRIIDTEQKVEPGHSPYTLYCIQYWGIFHDISSTTSAPDLVRQKVNVKRRFREFLALQSRLEDIPDLKLCLKGIKGPSKWLATPFSNLDKKNIAERKVFLENYLLELCKQDIIVKSSILQEFLAYGGDASIAFVKKAADLNVPRIDKMIFRGVKGAIDMFKTALPVTPTSSEAGSSKDGDSEVLESTDEDTSSELKFHECVISFTKRDPAIVEDMENFLRHFGLPSSTESLFQSDISLLDCMVVDDSFPPNRKRHQSIGKFNLDSDITAEDNSEDLGNPMTDAMIDLGVEVVQNIPRFIKTQRLIFFIKNLFGPLLDVVTEKVLEIVLTKENCAALLHIVHRAVWPDPKPSSGQADSYIDKGHLLNEAIREYIMEAYRMWAILLLPMKPILSETLDILLGSIQNKEMNKCLLFHMCDVIIHSLCIQEIQK